MEIQAATTSILWAQNKAYIIVNWLDNKQYIQSIQKWRKMYCFPTKITILKIFKYQSYGFSYNSHNLQAVDGEIVWWALMLSAMMSIVGKFTQLQIINVNSTS